LVAAQVVSVPAVALPAAAPRAAVSLVVGRAAALAVACPAAVALVSTGEEQRPARR
jgi:hypothetical protein